MWSLLPALPVLMQFESLQRPYKAENGQENALPLQCVSLLSLDIELGSRGSCNVTCQVFSFQPPLLNV